MSLKPSEESVSGREGLVVLNDTVGACKIKRNNWPSDLVMWRSLTKGFEWSSRNENGFLKKNVKRAFTG